MRLFRPGRFSFFYGSSLLIACLMPFALGCGKSEEGSKTEVAQKTGKKTRILLLDTGIEDANKKVWGAAIKSFESAHPDAKVDLEVHKDDDYSQGGLLISRLGSDTPPDVYFEWSWAAVARDANSTKNKALDLTSYITPEWRATFESGSWSGTDFDGKTYMIPIGADAANLIFYKKKVLADHGIEPPKTWDEFVAACKKLREAGIDPIFQGNQGAWVCGNWAAEIAVSYMGLDKYRKAGTKPPQTKLSDPDFVKAVSLLKQLYDARAFNSDLNTLDDREGMAHFTQGPAAFTFAGSWVLDVLGENGGDAVFAILPRPQLPGEPAGPRMILANSAGYMVCSKTARPDLAFDLLKHLMKPEVQRFRILGGLNSANIEAQKEITSPLQLAVQKVLKESPQWVAAPDISWERYTAERFYQAVKEVVSGAAEPQAALEEADRDVAKNVR